MFRNFFARFFQKEVVPVQHEEERNLPLNKLMESHQFISKEVRTEVHASWDKLKAARQNMAQLQLAVAVAEEDGKDREGNEFAAELRRRELYELRRQAEQAGFRVEKLESSFGYNFPEWVKRDERLDLERCALAGKVLHESSDPGRYGEINIRRLVKTSTGEIFLIGLKESPELEEYGPELVHVSGGETGVRRERYHQHRPTGRMLPPVVTFVTTSPSQMTEQELKIAEEGGVN